MSPLPVPAQPVRPIQEQSQQEAPMQERSQLEVPVMALVLQVMMEMQDKVK